MIYRDFGKTGLKVSQLGFGAMRLPMIEEQKKINRELAIPMIHRAFQGGVNYIDSAVGYCYDDSQRVVGEALKAWPDRDKIIVSTKNPYYDEDEKTWWKNLTDSLDRLGVESIDIYHHHGINWKNYQEKVIPHVGKWMRKAYDQGLIKHICTSFHDDNAALMKLIDTGYPEVITVQYNMLNRDMEEGIAYAHEKGIGIVGMGPVAGGRLGDNSDVLSEMVPNIKRVPELALRFVLSNPNVSLALSGMSTMEQVEENIAITSDEISLSDADVAVIDEHLVRLKKMADLYCTGCKYCLPCEAAAVDIPRVFDLYNHARVWGMWDHAKLHYNLIGKNENDKYTDGSACTECGECEEKCPQNIPIRQQLKEAHKALFQSK